MDFDLGWLIVLALAVVAAGLAYRRWGWAGLVGVVGSALGALALVRAFRPLPERPRKPDG